MLFDSTTFSKSSLSLCINATVVFNSTRFVPTHPKTAKIAVTDNPRKKSDFTCISTAYELALNGCLGPSQL